MTKESVCVVCKKAFTPHPTIPNTLLCSNRCLMRYHGPARLPSGDICDCESCKDAKEYREKYGKPWEKHD